MADSIAVMNGGRIEQLGRARGALRAPATAFVAGFLGVSNLCRQLSKGPVPCASTTARSSGRQANGMAGRVAAGVRPEKITLGEDGGAEPPLGDGRGDGLHRRRHANRGEDARGHGAGLRAEHRLRSGACRRRDRRSRSAGVPSRHSSSSLRRRGGGTMSIDDHEEAAASARSGRGDRAVAPRPARRLRRAAVADDGVATRGELKDVLNFSNWALYIDTPSTRKAAGLTGPTTLQQFTAKTGIKVNYYEDVNDNSGYFAKVQGRLSQGRASTATSSSRPTTTASWASTSPTTGR